MNKIDWFNEICTHLQKVDTNDFWSDGNQIMCLEMEQADFLGNLIESLYRSQGEDIQIITGYYDKREDEQQGTVDNYSNMWYVTIE